MSFFPIEILQYNTTNVFPNTDGTTRPRRLSNVFVLLLCTAGRKKIRGKKFCKTFFIWKMRVKFRRNSLSAEIPIYERSTPGHTVLYLGPGRACRMWARVFEGLTSPCLRAWGLDCRLSPKSRPVWARALGISSKSPSLQVEALPSFQALAPLVSLVSATSVPELTLRVLPSWRLERVPLS
jgi:hypothetical protein